MREILEKLNHKEIINDKIVLDLKNYISNKYPHLSSYETSVLFADSIHKIIDNNIKHFDKKHREEIKKSLISSSVHKKSFTINADEIFYAFINLKSDSDRCLDGLTNWMNENQNIEISKEYLLDFITEVKKYDKGHTIDAIHKVIEEMDFKLEDDTKKNNEEETSVKEINITDKQLNSKVITSDNIHKLIKDKNLGIIIGVFLITLLSLTIYIININTEKVIPVKADDVMVSQARSINELSPEFKYKDIDIEKLRIWLDSRDSKLAEEPYLTAIVNAAERYDINPLLLIAITGQEQGFVPKSSEYSEKIVNNPFNVYGSWVKYNTNIHDSSEIAAITIVNLSKNRPSDIDTIRWINRKYAEDENWHKGVSKIFNMLCKELGVN